MLKFVPVHAVAALAVAGCDASATGLSRANSQSAPRETRVGVLVPRAPTPPCTLKPQLTLGSPEDAPERSKPS